MGGPPRLKFLQERSQIEMGVLKLNQKASEIAEVHICLKDACPGRLFLSSPWFQYIPFIKAIVLNGSAIWNQCS